jgi:hypothetical protein
MMDAAVSVSSRVGIWLQRIAVLHNAGMMAKVSRLIAGWTLSAATPSSFLVAAHLVPTHVLDLIICCCGVRCGDFADR